MNLGVGEELRNTDDTEVSKTWLMEGSVWSNYSHVI